MRWQLLGAALAAASISACSGSQVNQGGRPVAKNAPEWVNRGSRVVKGSIFGVGAVSGIANTALAQDTARNRARAEISRILEVYSASLMKDFQSSTTAGDFKSSDEQQLVEQAIKTFSANLLKGSEQSEMWLDANENTWFSLVELNFEKAQQVAILQSKMSPGLKDWVEKNGDDVLKDLEDSTSTPPPAQNPPPPAAGNNPPPANPQANTPPVRVAEPPPGPPAQVGGPRPGWTDGGCDRNRYLCGVGSGSGQVAADTNARAELARTFSANIRSLTQSFEGAVSQISSKTGEQWVEVQAVSQFSMVSTDKVVTMSQILHRWDDGKGTVWALAVIDRAQAAQALTEKIRGLDSLIGDEIGRAKGSADRIQRFKNLKRALQGLLEREALNSDLRVVRVDGRGIDAPYSVSDILALLDAAAGKLRFGLALAGAGAERVRSCLEEALTDRGYQIEANVDEDEDDISISGDFDVLIKGKVRAEKRGKIAGGQVVQTTLTLKLINAKTNRILRTITDRQKATRPSVKAAASTAAYKICKKKVPSMVKDIDRYFGR